MQVRAELEIALAGWLSVFNVMVLYVPEIRRKENRQAMFTHKMPTPAMYVRQHRQIGVRWARFASPGTRVAGKKKRKEKLW